jgi:hypothetical protein
LPRALVVNRPDVSAALRWVVPVDEFTASPDWAGVPRLLARLRALADGPDGLPGLIARVVGRHPLHHRPQRLFESAHLAASMFGEQFTESDIMAIDRLLSATFPRLEGLAGLETFVRYLFNDPRRTVVTFQQYSAAPYVRLLIEMVRHLDRDVTDQELRRQVVGIDPPSSPPAAELARAWRMRLREHYAHHYNPLLQQLRAHVRPHGSWSAAMGAQTWNEEQVLWDAVELVHAAHPGARLVTLAQARAARAVLDSPMAEGRPPLRNWADVQRFIVGSIRGMDDPQPAAPGAGEADVRRLLAAASAAMAARPGDPVDESALRYYWWNPPSYGPGPSVGAPKPLPGMRASLSQPMQANGAARILADLRAAARADAEPAGLLGPDIFELRKAPPPPPFLAGVDQAQLTPEQLYEFFALLDMAAERAPEVGALRPDVLAGHEDIVLRSHRGPERRSWTPDPSVLPEALRELPEVLELPLLFPTCGWGELPTRSNVLTLPSWPRRSMVGGGFCCGRTCRGRRSNARRRRRPRKGRTRSSTCGTSWLGPGQPACFWSTSTRCSTPRLPCR